MHLLFHIVYGTHASGTHHKLALDALRHLKSTNANRWQRMLLAHARLYLEGAEAPDDDFKDFENHVLLPRDGLWGGAPEKVRSWYGHVVEALGGQDWPTAAYCAGVLSHYYTDPLQPFHTAQSEAENNIHRAVEWSIARSYRDLRALGVRAHGNMDIEIGSDPNWLAELVCRGAERANRHYEKLIAHYDIGRGVVDPPAGLDRVGRRIVAEMLQYATLSFAAVLDRAIAEAGASAPATGLAAASLLAALQAPVRLLANRRADGRERRAVEAIYDELQATGTVEQHLPEEERIVRERYASEVLARRAPAPPASQVFPFRPRQRVVTRIDREREVRKQDALLASADVIPLRRPGEMVSAAAAVPVAAASAHASTTTPVNVTRQPMLFLVPSPPRDGTAAASASHTPEAPASGTGHADREVRAGRWMAPESVPQSVPPQATPEELAAERPRRARRNDAADAGLTLDDDLADGPAIGGKLVKRLRSLDIHTVRDLLKADPEALALLLDAKPVTAQIIGAWQDQALLMCGVPGLKPAHAQLLEGAGYRSAEAIAAADAEKLCADVIAFAATPAGQKLLRNGEVPDMARIEGWLEAAQRTRAA
ncbi:MAG TPA: DUF4332 domain-containing protein [Hyphomicrobiaceae bacterium]|nr:DUF4332 domain-containing protein [Hyphomicrobiaceae bacterium]